MLDSKKKKNLRIHRKPESQTLSQRMYHGTLSQILKNKYRITKFNMKEILRQKKVRDFDLRQQKNLGKDAIKLFQTHYKSMKKIKQQNSFNKNDDSMLTKMFKHQQKNLLLPKKLQIVKWNGDDT